MEKITVNARVKITEGGKEIWKDCKPREIDSPNSTEDAVKIFGSMLEICEAAMAHKIVMEQSDMRNELKAALAGSNGSKKSRGNIVRNFKA